RRRAPSRRVTGFSCRRQEVRFTGFASSRLRKSDAYAGTAGGLAAASENVLKGSLETAWKLLVDQNAKVSRKNLVRQRAADSKELNAGSRDRGWRPATSSLSAPFGAVTSSCRRRTH